ncbi:MAG: rhomboid family intramembrane serine protease [Thaumarchaeota archaeon]|nr:rhomboid family intramembrane serine protease [Nitrososphaerota archaeon]
MNICENCGADNPDASTYCKTCGSPLNSAGQRKASDSEDVKKCSYCAKPLVGEDAYYFRCRYCEQDFCYDHRLPENHLCKSSPLRRNIPSSTSSPYYSTGGGYYSTSGRSSPKQSGGFQINFSKQGRNLAILIGAGLVLGYVFSYIGFDGVPITNYLIQYNAAVYQGWYLPLLTSIIIVAPGSLGLLDVFFNAISIVWLDRLLSTTYSSRQYYLVFVLTGVAGNILSLLNGPDIVSFGASGGIFGLVAGAVTADYAINHRINGSLLAWFLFIFIYSSFAGSVDLFAHLGGAIAGLIAGYIIGRSRRSATRYS